MILHLDKFQLILLGGPNRNLNFVYHVEIKQCQEEKWLVIIIENKLSFKTHLNCLYKKDNQNPYE